MAKGGGGTRWDTHEATTYVAGRQWLLDGPTKTTRRRDEGGLKTTLLTRSAQPHAPRGGSGKPPRPTSPASSATPLPPAPVRAPPTAHARRRATAVPRERARMAAAPTEGGQRWWRPGGRAADGTEGGPARAHAIRSSPPLLMGGGGARTPLAGGRGAHATADRLEAPLARVWPPTARRPSLTLCTP